MYTSTLDKIDRKNMFIWVMRRTGASPTSPLLPHPILPLLFNLLAIISFVTTTFENFQFQSQVRLCQINIEVQICLKFELCGVFTKWGSRKKFLFVGRQDIINYWETPSKVPWNCHKGFVAKIVWHDSWEMFRKMSLLQLLQFLAQQIPSNQHPHVLQLGRHIYLKKELLFSE